MERITVERKFDVYVEVNKNKVEVEIPGLGKKIGYNKELPLNSFINILIEDIFRERGIK